MGYTHYWQKNNRPDHSNWNLFSKWVKKAIGITESRGIHICGPLGTGKPKVTNAIVSFNGDETKGEDHETFHIDIDECNGFNFCKTAQKPYDELVVACLMKAAKMGVIDEWSSDGNESEGDFEEGIALLKEVDSGK